MSEATLTRALCRAALFAVALIVGVLLTVALADVLMALYLSIDHHRLLAYLVVFVPEQRQQQARRVTRQIAIRLGQWVSGQPAPSARSTDRADHAPRSA